MDSPSGGLVFIVRGVGNVRFQQKSGSEVRVVAGHTIFDCCRVTSVGLLAEIFRFVVAVDAGIEHRLFEEASEWTAVHFMAGDALTVNDGGVADIRAEVARVACPAGDQQVIPRIHPFVGVMASGTLALDEGRMGGCEPGLREREGGGFVGDTRCSRAVLGARGFVGNFKKEVFDLLSRRLGTAQ